MSAFLNIDTQTFIVFLTISGISSDLYVKVCANIDKAKHQYPMTFSSQIIGLIISRE